MQQQPRHATAPRLRSSTLFDFGVFHRRSIAEQQNTAARHSNLRSGPLSAVLCFAAIAIAIVALIGYVLGNVSVASLSFYGEPVSAVTSAGTMSRLLLPAVFVVPLLALAVREVNDRWFAPEAGLTAFVAIHAFFGAAIVLSMGVILLKRERDRELLASIVDSSTDSIVGTSVTASLARTLHAILQPSRL